MKRFVAAALIFFPDAAFASPVENIRSGDAAGAPTPCGEVYHLDFKGYEAGTSLFAHPLNYVGVTRSSSDWFVVSSPQGQAASHHGAGWTHARFGESGSGYLDLKATCDASAGRTNLFFNTSTFNGVNSIPADGYYLQIVRDNPITLNQDYGGRYGSLIGVSSVAPNRWWRIKVEIRDNAGVIDVFIDGKQAIHVVDQAYTSGFWGFGGFQPPGFISDVSLDRGTCLPSNTATSTPVPTPTPPFVPKPCGAPYPAVFTPVLTPVLVARAAFEQGCVGEPSVNNIRGVYHMTYSANAFSLGRLPCVIGLATSADGLIWTRQPAPLIGNGHGGEPGAASRSTQVKVGSEYRVYYKDGYGNIRYAASRDGYAYTAVARPAIPFNRLNQYGARSFDNTGFYFDGKTWWCLVDAAYRKGIQFRLWLFKSTDGARTFQPVGEGPLTSISTFTDYGSPRAFTKIGRLWHLWYLYNVPSNIYHAVSPDLQNWYPDKMPVLTFSPHMFGLASCNQAADTCLLDMGSRVFLYYDGTDNVHAAEAIGVAIYPKSLASYGASWGKSSKKGSGRPE